MVNAVVNVSPVISPVSLETENEPSLSWLSQFDFSSLLDPLVS